MKICAERQKVLDATGHVLVVGGPGSGKTTIALKKAFVRVEAGMLPGQGVLFLSFSRAAVARIVQASCLELPRKDRALLDVQTFHSFFWDLLKTHAYLLGAPRQLRILLPQDERVLNGGVREDKQPKAWDLWCQERHRLFSVEGRIGFDLFAPKAAELLAKSDWIRKLVAEKYPLMIVDEAQDTGPDAWQCMELLAGETQVICLADLEQQIFDHLPGIGPERIESIKAALSPLEVNLGSENLRSPGSEIGDFGRDILLRRARVAGYKGVSFNRSSDLGVTMRKALGCLQREIKKETGKWGKTIAILVPPSPEAAKVSVSLNSGKKPVQHKLLFDEAEALLAARFAAYLLEPRQDKKECHQIPDGLLLLSNIKKSSGATGDVTRWQKWADKCEKGEISNAGMVQALRKVLSTLTTAAYSGDPGRDWTLVKRRLRESKEPVLIAVAQHLDYLVAFNRGKRISANLVARWENDGAYSEARQALDSALTQDLIVNGVDDPDGIQVMTIHKSKAKQFDGVVLLRRETHNGQTLISNFIWRDDTPPYRRSRRILMVGVTRARVHTLMVQQVWPTCPIMSAFTLRSVFSR
jgi:DNA helicase II / ATP-dependent DNA helicase PcrA